MTTLSSACYTMWRYRTNGCRIRGPSPFQHSTTTSRSKELLLRDFVVRQNLTGVVRFSEGLLFVTRLFCKAYERQPEHNVLVSVGSYSHSMPKEPSSRKRARRIHTQFRYDCNYDQRPVHCRIIGPLRRQVSSLRIDSRPAQSQPAPGDTPPSAELQISLPRMQRSQRLGHGTYLLGFSRTKSGEFLARYSCHRFSQSLTGPHITDILPVDMAAAFPLGLFTM